MPHEQFINLVKRLEEESERKPKVYLLKVLGIVGLGLAYMLGIFFVIAFLALFLLVALIKSPFLLIKLGLPLVGLLWIMVRALNIKINPPEGIPLTKQTAPDLFDEINSLNRVLKTVKIHKVLLTHEYNAAVAQIPRFGILGWHTNYLIIGLPLLQALSQDQFRAVLAHELGHLSRSHGKFGAWIYRVRKTWQELMDRLEVNNKRWMFLFNGFIRWYAPKLQAYTFVLARQQEYEADRCSVEAAGSRSAADMLLQLEIGSRNLDNLFWKNINKRPMKQEQPPLLYHEMGQFLRQPVDCEPTNQWLAEALREETAYHDTHPSLQDRLRALVEVARIPDHWLISAAEIYLGQSLDSLTEQLNREWTENVKESWTEKYHHYQDIRQRLQYLKKQDRKDLNENQLWELARITEELHGTSEALPLYESLIAEHEQAAYAYVAAGTAILHEDETSRRFDAIAYLNKAMELDHEYTFACCQEIIAYYDEQGDKDKAREYVERIQQYAELADRTRQEREQLSPKDTFEPHGLETHQLAPIARELQLYKAVKAAYLIRKKVEIFPERQKFVLFVTVKRPLLADKEDFFREIANNLTNEETLPPDTSVIILNERKKFRRVARQVCKLFGATIFDRRRGYDYFNPVSRYRYFATKSLIKSIYQHRATSVRFWLDAGADPNLMIDNELPLAVAAGEGELEIIQGLLDAGAHVNFTNSDGNTALFWSAYEGHGDAVKLLLRNGADPNIRFISGRTVLSPVCMHGYHGILKMLLEAGAQPIYTCYEAGETPLMIAVYNGRYDCVETLLANQADPNVRDQKGNTALRFALELELNEIHGLLVRYGAVL